MKRCTLILALIALIPVMGLAEAPTTQPASEFSTPSGSGPGFKPDRPMRPGMGPWTRREREGPPLSAAELEATEQFLKDNLPNRYQLFAQLRPNAPMRTAVLEFMAFRYRAMLRAKDFDTEMYDQLLKEAKLEDDAIGLVKNVREHPGDASAESALQAKAAELVQLSLDGRQARIARLEKALQEQKDQLAADSEHKQDRVDDKAKNLKKQFNGLFDRMDRLPKKLAPDKPVGNASPSPGTHEEKVGEIYAVSTVP